MPLVSATYLFKNQFKDPCLKIMLGHSNRGGLSVTLSRVVVYVYSPTERTECSVLNCPQCFENTFTLLP
jgi:hypothetical protein